VGDLNVGGEVLQRQGHIMEALEIQDSRVEEAHHLKVGLLRQDGMRVGAEDYHHHEEGVSLQILAEVMVLLGDHR
jgi:hypothetical protein